MVYMVYEKLSFSKYMVYMVYKKGHFCKYMVYMVYTLGHFGEIIQIWAFQGHKIPYFDINSLKMCFIHPLNQLEAISSNL